MQRVNYRRDPKDLMIEMNHLLSEHIKLTDIIPEARTETGRVLISNGLFHVLWGKVLERRDMGEHFKYYYQTIYPKLTCHHTEFENAFN